MTRRREKWAFGKQDYEDDKNMVDMHNDELINFFVFIFFQPKHQRHFASAGRRSG